MTGLVLFSILLLVDINQSTAERNFSKCSARYCYFWNGNFYSSEHSKPCPEEHWTLEIYDEGVQNDVLEFISTNSPGLPLIGHFALLNLSCKNSTTCTWKHSNQTATYFNWENNVDWSQEDVVYYFRAEESNEANKWNRIGQYTKHSFAKLCMKTNQIRNTVHREISEIAIHSTGTEAAATITSQETEIRTSSKNVTKDNIYSLYIPLALTVSAMILAILIGVVLLVVLNKRLRIAMTSSLSSSSSSNKSRKRGTTSVNNKVVQQFSNESGNTIYAEVPEAPEDNFNQNQTSMQYADLNWSTNISEIQQNHSKPVEDQKANYFGPMGDVYARVQKAELII